jgi:hypothetical protein
MLTATAARAPHRPNRALAGLRCRIRLADGRLFAGELPPERHRSLQIGLLHQGSDGLVELVGGARREGRLQITTPPARRPLPAGRACGEKGWPAGLIGLAASHAERGEEVFLAPAVRSRPGETELQRKKAFEFDDVLTFAVRLLAEHPHQLTWLRQRWRWILADEFQDTSHAQAMLVDLLAGTDGNLCVVGDDDQLIHGWRHADPRHILGFAARHPDDAEIVLGRDFRSRTEILEAALSCVQHNEHRAPNALIAMRGTGG